MPLSGAPNLDMPSVAGPTSASPTQQAFLRIQSDRAGLDASLDALAMQLYGATGSNSAPTTPHGMSVTTPSMASSVSSGGPTPTDTTLQSVLRAAVATTQNPLLSASASGNGQLSGPLGLSAAASAASPVANPTLSGSISSDADADWMLPDFNKLQRSKVAVGIPSRSTRELTDAQELAGAVTMQLMKLREIALPYRKERMQLNDAISLTTHTQRALHLRNRQDSAKRSFFQQAQPLVEAWTTELKGYRAFEPYFPASQKLIKRMNGSGGVTVTTLPWMVRLCEML